MKLDEYINFYIFDNKQKIMVSIGESLLNETDKYCKANNLTRSRFIQMAILKVLLEVSGKEIEE